MRSTQSSATIAFRALAMLGFVAAISWIAFSGTVMPEKARKLWDTVRPVISSAISTARAKIMTEAPSSNAKPQSFAAVPGQTSNGIANQPGQLIKDDRAVLLPAPSSGSGGERYIPPPSNVVPANYQSAVESGINRPGFKVQNETNPFIAIQDRLRELGASYYLLETWGNRRQFFRFYCQMSMGGNASYTHYFEATNADPMGAMADVLGQVEAWRSGNNGMQLKP